MKSAIRASCLLVVAAVLVAVCGWLPGCSRPGEAPAAFKASARMAVAVADFELFSDDKSDKSVAHLRQGVPAVLCTGISQVSALDVIARQSLLDQVRKEQKLAEDGLVDRATAVRAGRLLGARFMVGGGVHLADGRVRLDAQVVDVETGRVVFSTTVSGVTDDLWELQAQLAEQIAESMCESLGVELTDRQRLAVRGEHKGGFDSFLAYSQGMIAERAGKHEEARRLFEKALTESGPSTGTPGSVDAILDAALGRAEGKAPDTREAGDRRSRLDAHRQAWQTVTDGSRHDANWLAAPIILSAHAGLRGDFAEELRLLGVYWKRFTETVPPEDAIATAADVAGVIRREEEFFRATVDSGDYGGIPGMSSADDNLHADLGDGFRWPRFSRLWPFDDTLRMMENTARRANGQAVDMVRETFMGRLAKLPHDYLEAAIVPEEVCETLYPGARRPTTSDRSQTGSFGESLALCGDVLGYCSRIPNPPEKLLTDLESMRYTFLHDLANLPSALSSDALEPNFLARVLPVLDALSKAAPTRKDREASQALLVRFARQRDLASGEAAQSPTGRPSPTFLGVPITAKKVLVVWHEDDMIGLDTLSQESMIREGLRDLVLGLSSDVQANIMLALGRSPVPKEGTADRWILEEPRALDAPVKRKLLRTLEDNESRQFAESSLFDDLEAALGTATDDTLIILVRVRDDSATRGGSGDRLAETKPGVVIHAVLSADSPEIEKIVRGHRGTMIFLEKNGDLIFGDVQKRTVDTTRK